MSQVLQCTQFCALICRRDRSVIVAHDLVDAPAITLHRRVIAIEVYAMDAASLSVADKADFRVVC
jgi:hypothetical protein